MDEFLQETVKQVPALAVLVWLMAMTFRHLRDQQQLQREYDAAREERVIANQAEFIAHLKTRDEQADITAAVCHEVQRDAIEVMRETNRIIGENSVALHKARAAVTVKPAGRSS